MKKSQLATGYALSPTILTLSSLEAKRRSSERGDFFIGRLQFERIVFRKKPRSI